MALAKAYGAAGFRAQTISDLKAVLHALKDLKNQPALVEIVIPEKDLAGQMKRLGEE
jgi:indolepyruvate decarboxylase